MSITAMIVVYVMLWFLTLFVVLPIKLVTQGDDGDVTPGTHAGAPVNANLKRRFRITTIIATILWAVIVTVILSGWVTLADVDLFRRFGPGSGG